MKERLKNLIKLPTSREERDKFIKYFLVYPGVAIIAVIVVYLIMASGDKEEPKKESQFNTEVPEANEEKLADNKQTAYAEQVAKQESEERATIKSMAESMIESRKEIEVTVQKSTPSERVMASTEAYHTMNQSIGNFYSAPKADPEKERLQQELEELKAQLAEQTTAQPTLGVEEQMAIMERSYELAAKYSPSGQTSQEIISPAPQSNGKSEVSAVGQVSEQVVTTLAPQIKPSGYSFNTAIGSEGITKRNTIAAVIHSDQTLRDGEAVRLRLLEPMMAGDRLLARGSLVTGQAKVQGERLSITVNHLVSQGVLIPVELMVIDGDGQEGIFIPNSMEVSALKSIVANMSGSASTTINLTEQSAGDQILTDLGTSAIDGIAQYVAAKAKEVKVHLKAGHRVMLYQKM